MSFIYIDENGIGYWIDGNMYGAARADGFENIQESTCGFGVDYESARLDLEAREQQNT